MGEELELDDDARKYGLDESLRPAGLDIKIYLPTTSTLPPHNIRHLVFTLLFPQHYHTLQPPSYLNSILPRYPVLSPGLIINDKHTTSSDH